MKNIFSVVTLDEPECGGGVAFALFSLFAAATSFRVKGRVLEAEAEEAEAKAGAGAVGIQPNPSTRV
jgi:hypothetical protein